MSKKSSNDSSCQNSNNSSKDFPVDFQTIHSNHDAQLPVAKFKNILLDFIQTRFNFVQAKINHLELSVDRNLQRYNCYFFLVHLDLHFYDEQPSSKK